MAIVKITSWNSEKGFGFVNLAVGHAFVHVSAINPRLPRNIDLTGRDLEVLGTEKGDKGLKVTKAKVTPLAHVWSEIIGTLYHSVVYVEGGEPQPLSNFVVFHETYDAVPSFDQRQADAAKAAGCPDEVMGEARQYYEEKLARWKEAEADKADHAAAIEAARVLLKTLPEEQGVLVYVVVMPTPTQFLDQQCVDMFNTNWQLLMSKLTPSGSNAHYAWAVVLVAGAMELSVIAQYSYSHMDYKFSAVGYLPRKDLRLGRYETRIFDGKLSCGEGSPHHMPSDRDWRGL